MRYYTKSVYPKEATTDPDFKELVKERIAHHLVDAVLDNMTFDETDEYRCSICNGVGYLLDKFCKHCGAEMKVINHEI